MWIEKTIDRESQQKLYVQMYSIIKEKIEKLEWTNSSQIPTEEELCRTYNVSKATVRMAISELVRNGYLRKQQGKGTFVTSLRQHLEVAMKTKLTEDMFGEGVKAKKEVLEKELKEASEEMKSVFNLSGKPADSTVMYSIVCKRVVNGETAYLEESFILLSVMPHIENEDFCRKPLYDLIQDRGVNKIFKVVQTIEVAELRSNAAFLLNVRDGTPGILLHRLLIGADRNPIAYTRLSGPGRQYKIQTEFERIG